MPPAPALLTLSEAAIELRCSRRTVERRIASGALPVFRDGALVRVRAVDLARYVQRRTSRPPEPMDRPRSSASRARSIPTPVVPGRKLWEYPDPTT